MPKMRVVLTSVLVVVGAVVLSPFVLDFVLTRWVISHQRNTRCAHVETLRTGEQWLQSVKFPYAAPRERVRQVIDNHNRVEVGSSEAFGPPDFEQDLIPKEPWRPCVGYDFVYYSRNRTVRRTTCSKIGGLARSRSPLPQMARRTGLAAPLLVYNTKADQCPHSRHAVRRLKNRLTGHVDTLRPRNCQGQSCRPYAHRSKKAYRVLSASEDCLRAPGNLNRTCSWFSHSGHADFFGVHHDKFIRWSSCWKA
jgi:hypothetical protein